MGRAVAGFGVAPGPAAPYPPETDVDGLEINGIGDMNCGRLHENRHCHDVNPAGITRSAGGGTGAAKAAQRAGTRAGGSPARPAEIRGAGLIAVRPDPKATRAALLAALTKRLLTL